MREPDPASPDTQNAGEPADPAWSRWSSDLHESLATQEASAAELRQELDDLRRTLDAAPRGTEPGAHRSSRMSSRLFSRMSSGMSSGMSSRRRTVVAGAGAVLAVAAATGIAARTARQGSPVAAPSSATSTPSTGVRSGAGVTATTSSRPPAASASRAPIPSMPTWPGRTVASPAGLPAHGAGADAGGTEVTAALAADRRSVEVYERALLTPGASSLTLRIAGLADLARSLRAPLPAVQDLHAEVDGRPAVVTPTGSGWTVTAPEGSPATRLVLRYRLSGALVRPQPAPPGRYTLLLTPLAPSAADGVVVVRVRDPRVDELYCPGAGNQLCGREYGPLHVATVPTGAVPVVVALITFPS